MSLKMVARILSISVALLLLGMVVPSLSDASVGTAAEVDFGQVLINSSPVSTTLGIQNENETSEIQIYFNLSGTCGFEFDPEEIQDLQGAFLKKKGEPGDSVSVTIYYAPTDLGECSDTLHVYWVLGGFNDVPVILKGEGVDKLGPSTVIIDGYDTGVENRLNDNKPISEHLAMCEENAKNHGQYVRCVAFKTRKMRRANVLNERERRAIMKAAAHANIPPIEAGLEDLVHDGKSVVEWIDECRESAENWKQYKRCVQKLMKELKREDIVTSKKEMHQIRRYAAHVKPHGRHWEK